MRLRRFPVCSSCAGDALWPGAGSAVRLPAAMVAAPAWEAGEAVQFLPDGHDVTHIVGNALAFFVTLVLWVCFLGTCVQILISK